MTGHALSEQLELAAGDAAFAAECRSATDVDCTLVTLSPLGSTPEGPALSPVDYVVFGVAIGAILAFAVMAAFLESWLTFVRKLDEVELEKREASEPETTP